LLKVDRRERAVVTSERQNDTGAVAEVERAFAQGNFGRAAELSERILESHPSHPKALQVGLQSLASLGETRSIFALLNRIGIAGRPRREGIKVAMRAATKAGRLDCGLSLAARLAGHVDSDPAVLGDIASLIVAKGDPAVLEEYVDLLPSAEDRSAVRALWASTGGDLASALTYLADVPSAHPLRLRAVRSAAEVAAADHNEPAIYRLGMELLVAGDKVRLPIWRTWQAALLEGSPEEGRKVFLRGEDEAARALQSNKEFIHRWKTAANWYLNTFNVKDGLRVIDMAFQRRLTTEADHPIRELAGEFISEFEQELLAARSVLRGLVFGEPVKFPENELVRIVSRPRITNIGSHRGTDIDKGWLRLVTEVGRQVRKAGGSIGFVHVPYKDLAQKLAPVPLTLCYHLTGADAGTLHFKEADLPGYFSVDTHGYSGWSSLAARSVDELPLAGFLIGEVEEFFQRVRKHTIEANISKYTQSAYGNDAPLPPRFVFVALQTPGDRVQELARIPMLDMLDIVVRRFAGTAHRVVVKRHPLCRDRRVADRLAELSSSEKIVIRNDSIHALIASADAVITVNSGVGSEAAIHLKPVYIFGAADYAPISHSIATEAEFLQKTSPIALPVSEETIKRFLHFYRKRWLIDVFDNDALRAAVETRLLGSLRAKMSENVT
jgi:hypothetical protein